VIHYFRGRMVLSAEASQQAELLSRDLDSELAQLLQLADRSWRESSSKEAILTKWSELRLKHQDPMVELSYLISARYLLGSTGVLKEIRASQQAHPDWVTLIFLELRALRYFGDDAELMGAADKGLAVFPAATGLMLERGMIQLRQGRLEVAEENLKQVLIRDGNLIKARALLAGLYAQQKKEDKRVEQLLFALSDTVPSFEQFMFLNTHAEQLVNLGRAQEADKLWRACLDMVDQERDNNRRLACASSALEGVRFVLPKAKWGAWMGRMKEELFKPSIDPQLRPFYSLQLLMMEALKELDEGNQEKTEQILGQILSMSPDELPFNSKDFLVGSIQEELLLVKKERPALEDYRQKIQAAELLAEQRSCSSLYSEARIAKVLNEPKKIEAALQEIVDEACTEKSSMKGVLLAQSRLWLASLLVEKGEKERARKLIEIFRETWDSEEILLERMTSVAALEARL
jgi:tetratricopeptide (TPR) repeat protein